MFAQVSGLIPGELIHVIADCHIYDRHIPSVERMISLEPYDAPQFLIDPSIKDFYQFDRKSFRIENYQYHPFNDTIPVAI